MNNVIFGKTMENVRKQRDINFTITEERRNYLVSEPNYHTAKFFTEYILEAEMKKTITKDKAEILMKKPVLLGLRY